MPRISTVLGVCALLAVAGCASHRSSSAASLGLTRSGDDETDVALADVPQAVKDAATNAVPGLVLSEASRETEDGQEMYELEGTANGVEYEVEVTAAGVVKEVETDDESDDDGDEHDDD